jgi:hypothetical protein
MTHYGSEYLRYKEKYIELKKSYLSQHGGADGNERYVCDPSKTFIDICYGDPDGKYKTRDRCVNDCEGHYINHQLKISGLLTETIQFTTFILGLIDMGLHIYTKGGSALGLFVLQTLHNKYPNHKFEEHFHDYVDLNLIRDWDFAAYSDTPIDDDLKDKIHALTQKSRLASRASTFILYQARRPIQIDGNALFEITILDNEQYSKMEIPMTTMKIPITRHNLKYIFIFANSFYSNKVNGDPFDMDVITRMLTKINVKIKPHRKGLYIATQKTFDPGDLSRDMIKFINTFRKHDPNMPQFLVTHIIDPTRLFYRLLSNNLPKMRKICRFLIEKNIVKSTPDWMIDADFILDKVYLFIGDLSKKIAGLYRQGGIDAVQKFMTGVELNRICTNYDRTSIEGLEMARHMFLPLYRNIADDIRDLKNSDKNSVINILKFMVSKDMFDDDLVKVPGGIGCGDNLSCVGDDCDNTDMTSSEGL